MNKIEDIISELKEKWTTPSFTSEEGGNGTFKLACFFNEHDYEFTNVFEHPLPEDLIELWSQLESAELFKDVDYGQWGLEIFSPQRALEVTHNQLSTRPNDYTFSDVIIGRFIGDSDLLGVYCGSETDTFGKVFVSLPIDKRKDWPVIAHSLEEFFVKYSNAEGDKYWE